MRMSPRLNRCRNPPQIRAGNNSALTPAASAASKKQFKDRRLIVLFFDLSAMEPDEIDHAVTSAEHYVDTQMVASYLVSIVSLGSSLLVNQDFTTDHALLKKQLEQFSSTGSGSGSSKRRYHRHDRRNAGYRRGLSL